MSTDMYPDDAIEEMLKHQICNVCGKEIRVMIFKNTGVCSELCRKDRDNDHAPFRGGALSP